jgi:hypothetical protein
MLMTGVVAPVTTVTGGTPITLVTLPTPEATLIVKLPLDPLTKRPAPAVIVRTPVFEIVTVPVPVAGETEIPGAPIIWPTPPPPPPPVTIIVPSGLMVRPEELFIVAGKKGP